jgi:hypothetical protein
VALESGISRLKAWHRRHDVPVSATPKSSCSPFVPLIMPLKARKKVALPGTFSEVLVADLQI